MDPSLPGLDPVLDPALVATETAPSRVTRPANKTRAYGFPSDASDAEDGDDDQNDDDELDGVPPDVQVQSDIDGESTKKPRSKGASGTGSKVRWTTEEDEKLIGIIRASPNLSWEDIAARMGGRKPSGCALRWYNHLRKTVGGVVRQPALSSSSDPAEQRRALQALLSGETEGSMGKDEATAALLLSSFPPPEPSDINVSLLYATSLPDEQAEIPSMSGVNRSNVIRGRRTHSTNELEGKLFSPNGKVQKVHPCPAEDCVAAFKRSEHLKRHYRSVHMGAKPFPCEDPTCKKAFSRKDNLQQHMKMVHHTTSITKLPEPTNGKGVNMRKPPRSTYKDHSSVVDPSLEEANHMFVSGNGNGDIPTTSIGLPGHNSLPHNIDPLLPSWDSSPNMPQSVAPGSGNAFASDINMNIGLAGVANGFSQGLGVGSASESLKRGNDDIHVAMPKRRKEDHLGHGPEPDLIVGDADFNLEGLDSLVTLN